MAASRPSDSQFALCTLACPLLRLQNGSSDLICSPKAATRWSPQVVLFASRIVVSWRLGRLIRLIRLNLTRWLRTPTVQS